jgi:MFS family permease
VLGAALAGRPGAPDDRLRLVRPLGLLACASSAACLLDPGLPGLLALWFLAGVGGGGLLPANVAFVLRVEPGVRGRALSVAQVVLQVAQGLAVAGGGVLAGAVGPAAAVGWSGVLGLVGVAVMSLRWPAAMGGAHPRPVGMDEVDAAPTGGAAGPRSPAVGRVRLLVLLVSQRRPPCGGWPATTSLPRRPDSTCRGGPCCPR